MDNSSLVKNVFNKHANAYQERYMDVSLYHDSLDIFCNALPVKSRVLDVGCGPGNLTRYILDRRADCSVYGIDLAEKMIALANENNPEAVFEMMDCRNITKLKERFDGILLGFCLPYLTKEETLKLIADSAQMLAEDGVLYLSTMEDDYAKSGATKSSAGDPVYMYYHEEVYIREAILAAGMNIIDVRRKEYPGRDSVQVTDIIVIARK